MTYYTRIVRIPWNKEQIQWQWGRGPFGPIDDWITDNCIGKYLCTLHRDAATVLFEFERDDDALLFKLRWG